MISGVDLGEGEDGEIDLDVPDIADAERGLLFRVSEQLQTAGRLRAGLNGIGPKDVRHHAVDRQALRKEVHVAVCLVLQQQVERRAVIPLGVIARHCDGDAVVVYQHDRFKGVRSQGGDGPQDEDHRQSHGSCQ